MVARPCGSRGCDRVEEGWLHGCWPGCPNRRWMLLVRRDGGNFGKIVGARSPPRGVASGGVFWLTTRRGGDAVQFWNARSPFPWLRRVTDTLWNANWRHGWRAYLGVEDVVIARPRRLFGCRGIRRQTVSTHRGDADCTCPASWVSRTGLPSMFSPVATASST